MKITTHQLKHYTLQKCHKIQKNNNNKKNTAQPENTDIF